MNFARVTQASINTTTMRGLQVNLSSLQKLQEQLSSGKRVARPSDDPTATATAMLLSSQKSADEQFARNSSFATNRLGVTDSTLQALSDQLHSVRDLMVASRSGALTAEGRAALGNQINQISSEVVDLYNTRYLDRSIFGGTVNGSYAIDPTSHAYLGDDNPVTARVSHDSVVRVDVKGTDAGADVVPGLLAQIAVDVTSSTGSSVADADALDAQLTKIIQALGDVGARQNRIDTTKTLVDAHRDGLVQRISEAVDIDLPATVMNLQMQQVAYQSALGASAKILQKSLVDFLG
jgi:flagellar hook-associated protein 3 FlgL